MDPIDEATGVRKRLEHLGYRSPASEDSESEAEELDREAIEAFQKDQGMQPTGVLDDATMSGLAKTHGA